MNNLNPIPISPSMQDNQSFLKSKVTPPRRPLGLIARPRLARLVDEVDARLVTLVLAPAGYGKTTLGMTWADVLLERGEHVAWLTLDPEDDDPLRFVHYMRRALAGMSGMSGAGGEALFAARIAEFGVTADDVLVNLINEIVECGDELYLFIDDVQHLSSPDVCRLLVTLLRHAPRNLHLVLLSRAAPPIPLARLHAAGLAFELDARHLRFTAEETGALLCASDLPSTDTPHLQSMTDGWAAALRVAILARRMSPGAARDAGGTRGVRPLFDELASELLDQLPAGELGFLESVVIAERLCAPLCEALTGNPRSQSLLDALERRLLLTRLTEDGWFSCHQLLRDILIARVQSKGSAVVAALHHKASRWYAAQSIWSDAMRHALAARDTAQALGWIEQCAMPLVKRGDLLTLLDWEAQLHSALIGSPLALRVALAWAQVLGASSAENQRVIDAIENDARLADPAQRERIEWECRVIRAIALAQDDRPEAALTLAASCLSAPPRDAWMVNSVYNVLLFAHLSMRRWADFYATPRVTHGADEDDGNVFSAVYRLTLRGLGELDQLQSTAAEAHLIEALRIAQMHTGARSLPAALPATFLAWLHYERLDLDGAAHLLEDRSSIVPSSGFGDAIRIAFVVRARIECRQGDPERAYRTLEHGESIALSLGLPRLELALLLERLRSLLLANRQLEARACLQRMERCAGASSPDPTVANAMAALITLARAHLALAGGEARDAMQLFEAQLDASTTRGDHLLALHACAGLALAQASHGDGAAAATLARCIGLAALGGFRASLLDFGPAMKALLIIFAGTAAARELPSCASAFLAELIADGPIVADAEQETGARVLSPREQDILALVADAKSNKEISRILNITPETVKTHIKHIFAKLEVNRRSHAVKRAQTLRLMGTSHA